MDSGRHVLFLFSAILLSQLNPAQLLVAVALAASVAVASWYARFLSVSGSIATFVLASLIFGLGGVQWSVPILTFFITSSVLSRVGKKKKASYQLIFEKTDTRDTGQVAANGGVAGILLICSFLFPLKADWYLLYLASLSSVTADTWGTELGLLSGSLPRSITTLRRTETGTSGAVSISGLVGGAAGALTIAMSGCFWQNRSDLPATIATIVIAGVIGSLVDSLLGATAQARLRCDVCGKMTERVIHCATPTRLVGGVRWIRNDIVNWVCATAGPASVLLFMLLKR